MSLSDKALLVNLSISQWSAKKLDHKAMLTVEKEYNVNRDAGNYTKKLLPKTKELEDIQAKVSAIRVAFYKNTLPWFTDGSRIISAKHYLDFMNEFRKMKGDFEFLVDEFISKYASLRDNAKQSLGGLFDDTEYPEIELLRAKFDCNLTVMPVPSKDDFRVEMSESEIENFEKTLKEVESKIYEDIWGRLFNVVEKAASKLSQPDAVFRDSLIENIHEVCALLPKLNVNDNPELEIMRKNVEILVSKIDVNAVRDNRNQRHDVATSLKEIKSKMSAFMGVNNE